jgi:hypothetical protein
VIYATGEIVWYIPSSSLRALGICATVPFPPRQFLSVAFAVRDAPARRDFLVGRHTLSYISRRKFRQGIIDAASARARARATGFEPAPLQGCQKYPRLPPLTSRFGGTIGRRFLVYQAK